MVLQITGAYADEYSPVWDPEGNYLYFLAAREFAPQISSIEWNYAGSHDVQAYALALRAGRPFASGCLIALGATMKPPFALIALPLAALFGARRAPGESPDDAFEHHRRGTARAGRVRADE